MSLVAYGSSDESSDEEEVSPNKQETQEKVTIVQEEKKVATSSEKNVEETIVPHSMSHMSLPVPKYEQSSEKLDDKKGANGEEEEGNKCRLAFGTLPKPQSSREYSRENIVEEIVAIDDIPLYKPKPFLTEKPAKQDRAPVRISVPSLSDFKDVDEDLEKSKSRRQPSTSGIGLFAILPPPQSEVPTKKNNFIPHVLTKTATNPAPKKAPAAVTKVPEKISKDVKNPLKTLDYDSNSEDEEEGDDKCDFFSLSKPVTLPEPEVSAGLNLFTIGEDKQNEVSGPGNENSVARIPEVYETRETDETESSDMRLVSTVMNMPREEILLKNKAEVGPKLPVPEQEFHVDSAGNVAFDDKAIEYLCGKRGVKRRNQMIDEANIIEINGEDIKPDEREWLVKALTEEPVQRPVSMQSAGPSSQSKKKHQITYLAHQAKAMEVELKNTWSQNRMTRKQTQSKYGF